MERSRRRPRSRSTVPPSGCSKARGLQALAADDGSPTRTKSRCPGPPPARHSNPLNSGYAPPRARPPQYKKENMDYQTYFYARPRGEPKEEKPRSEFCRYTGINLLQWQRWPLLGLHVITFILCPTKKIRSSAIMALSLRSAEDASPATTPYELSFFNQW
nr:uncharacterized protein LOC127334717 isoform X2 [Lolium perenne]